MAKIANIFSYMSLTFAFIYSCHLTSAIHENKFKLWEIMTIVIMTIYAFYVNFISGKTIIGVTIESPSHFTIHFGQATPIFFLSLFIYTFLTLLKLIRSIKSNHIKIKQLKSIYTALGMIIYLITTATFHLITTFIYDDFSLTWLPPFLAIICLIIVGYTSVNYRFYSWRHLIHSTIRIVLTLSIYIIPIIFISANNDKNVYITFSVLWCFTYILHWKKITRLSAKISSLLVYKELYTPIDKIYTTSKEIHNSSQDLIATISQILKLDGELSIISLDDNLNSIYRKYLYEHKSALIIDEIEYQLYDRKHNDLNKIYYNMLENNSAVILPIFDNNDSIFQLLLLPRKSNGFLYANEEVHAIQYLLKEASFYLYCEHKIKQSQKAAISISYEMKTPLKEVKSYISKIEKRIKSTEKSTLLLHNIIDIYKAINYGNQIINTSLNDIERIPLTDHDKEYVCMGDILRESINDYTYDNEKYTDRIFLDVKDDFIVHANKTKIVFIIFNLLKNATYYFNSHPESTVEIKIISGLSFNKLIFKDYGPGIEKDIIDNIFNNFFTYKKHNGTGLGLSYCKRVMKAIDGDIYCNSVFGEHTEFVLIFPNINHSNNIKESTKIHIMNT
ncbi:sensor histidine kinase [Vibrio gazogenes]|nr:HAMP domain-containing sensor histidine kinase [Vibrio gazogenes]